MCVLPLLNGFRRPVIDNNVRAVNCAAGTVQKTRTKLLFVTSHRVWSVMSKRYRHRFLHTVCLSRKQSVIVIVVIVIVNTLYVHCTVYVFFIGYFLSIHDTQLFRISPQASNVLSPKQIWPWCLFILSLNLIKAPFLNKYISKYSLCPRAQCYHIAISFHLKTTSILSPEFFTLYWTKIKILS